MTIINLSDERRANKPWLPDDDRDVTTGLVLDNGGKPSCKFHGAMNRVHPIDRIYRCSEFRCGVGAEISPYPRIEIYFEEFQRYPGELFD